MDYRPGSMATGLIGDNLGFLGINFDQGFHTGERTRAVQRPAGWIPIEQTTTPRQRMTMKCALQLVTPEPHPRLSQARYALADRIVYTPHPRGLPPGSARPPGERDRGEEGVAAAIDLLEGEGQEVVGRGDLYFRVKCSGTQALDDLWKRYTDGELSRGMEGMLSIPNFGKGLGIDDLSLRVELTPGEYLVCLEEVEFEEREMEDTASLRDIMADSAERAKSGKFNGYLGNEENGTIEEEEEEEDAGKGTKDGEEDFDTLISELETSVTRPKTPYIRETRPTRPALLEQYEQYTKFLKDIKVSLSASVQIATLRRKQLAQRKRNYDNLKVAVKEAEVKVAEAERVKSSATFTQAKGKDSRDTLRREQDELASCERRRDNEKLHIKKILQQLEVIDPVLEKASDAIDDVTRVLSSHEYTSDDLEQIEHGALERAANALKSCSKQAKLVDRDLIEKLKL